MAETCDHCCVKIQNLSVQFGALSILKDIGLHINCGQLLAVIGPNGAGKTTLLKAILGEIPYAGKIFFRIGGKPNPKPKIGYVPQKLNFDLETPISVEDLLSAAMGRRPVWLKRSVPLSRKIAAALAKVSAEHLIRKPLGELSGGELQRVLLAMAMVPRPDLLLLDEPVSAVDVKGLALFYRIVNDLKKQYDISIIMATHDLAGIAPYADRMILLNHSVVAEGSPKDVLSNTKLLQVFGPSLANVSELIKNI